MATGRKSYPYELKLSAVESALEGVESYAQIRDHYNIASTAPLRRWVAAYRKGGNEALKPKTKGRPRVLVYEDVLSEELVKERNRLRRENEQLLRKLRG